MTTLLVSANTDFTVQTLTGIIGITFGGAFRASFNSTQFGPGLIANNCAITGATGNQSLEVYFPSGGGTFNASGWTFADWTDFTSTTGVGDRIDFVMTGGSNTIVGSNRADTFFQISPQSSGNDDLDGGLGVDTIDGGSGDDVLRSGVGNTLERNFLGGLGTDLLVIDRTGATANLTIRTNVIGDVAGIWSVSVERLDATGGAGNDTMQGGGFADRLIGGAGDDTIESTNGGVDVLDGGSGTGDHLIFVDPTATTQIVFSVAGQGSLFTFGNGTTATGFERVTLTTGSDADIVTGGGLGDTLSGGAGADILAGLGDKDTLNGDAGTDFLAGGDGDDTIVGGADSDILTGDAGNDTITFDFGDWYVSGGEGLDRGILSGTAGHRVDMAAFSFERFTGGGGADIIFTSGGHFMEVDGGAGGDVILGTADGDLLRGGNDGDLILGHAGGDAISGDAGTDRVYGGAGNDILVGGTGVDAFVFKEMGAANYDVVTDYAAGEKIELSPLDFVGLTAGVLAASQFALAGPTAAGPQIIFKISDGNGILEFDADGTGAGAAQVIAILAGVTTFSAADVFVGFTF